MILLHVLYEYFFGYVCIYWFVIKVSTVKLQQYKEEKCLLLCGYEELFFVVTNLLILNLQKKDVHAIYWF